MAFSNSGRNKSIKNAQSVIFLPNMLHIVKQNIQHKDIWEQSKNVKIILFQASKN